MLEDLKKQVKEANQKLVELGLVKLTFGNVSAIDDSNKLVAIKPSGVDYDSLKNRDIVILDLNGEIIEGDKRPSSDTPSHLELYRNFPGIKSVIHTHSTYATIFAQAKKPITCFGTTHADYFRGDIPLTRDLTEEEVKENYELNAGKVMVETFQNRNINHLEMFACLLPNHAPFVWGRSIDKTLENAFVLEEIAKTSLMTINLNPKINPINKHLLDKHFLRKHGKDAYYGQKK